LFLAELGRNPSRILLTYAGENWSLQRLFERATDYMRALDDRDAGKCNFVAVLLDNHPEHVAVIVALALSGRVWLPLDRRFKAAHIRSVLVQVPVTTLITEAHYRKTVDGAGFDGVVVTPESVLAGQQDIAVITAKPEPSSVRSLMFTSGSTGAPKGVQVTEQMYLAAGVFCQIASDADSEAVFYGWEPLNHIGGAQLIPMALISGARLALTDRFSVSRFWPEVIESQANRLHYLGGILELLLSASPTELDKQHKVQIGFGAGSTPDTAKAFEHRFGIPLREVYGMTEVSSFTSINLDGTQGSIGKVLPCYDLKLLNRSGQIVSTGEIGEITIMELYPGLVTPGYYKNPHETEAAFQRKRFYTGDLAFQDADGALFFVGRQKDVIRCKGENVSALAVELALRQHDQVLECAVVGTTVEGAEQEIVAFVKVGKQNELGNKDVLAKGIISQASHTLASFQLPRYLIFVSEFEKTPTERIKKHRLDVSKEVLAGAWDRKAGVGPVSSE
jgi:crotonobetaine/carnitine-CoA ligase